MENHTVTLWHPRRVHIVVLVVPKGGRVSAQAFLRHIPWDLLLLNRPQQFLSSRSVGGGVEEGGVGHHTYMPLVGVRWVNGAPCMSLPGMGGWETMVAGGAHHDEFPPLVEENLVLALHLGLPQGCFCLNVQAVSGGEGQKRERCQSDFAQSDGGGHGGRWRCPCGPANRRTPHRTR